VSRPALPTLAARVDALLAEVRPRYAGHTGEAHLDAITARLHDPLRVAIAGRVKAGKSTLLNALVGQELAATDARECTQIVTWYRYGLTYGVTIEPKAGPAWAARFDRSSGRLDIDLAGWQPDQLRRIVVTAPVPGLRDLTLIDTPGIDSLGVGVTERSLAFLAGQEDPAQADAVIYLLRHLHASDVRLLEAFHDQELTHAAPVHALAVLSRADEIGAARADAMASAGRIATRYAADPRLRRLCQTVCPVIGLLAEAAATLTEDEHLALRTVAELPDPTRGHLLRTVDRFRAERSDIPAPTATRAHLLDRLGLFGLRVTVEELSRGRVSSSTELAELLRATSGVEVLQDLLRTRFAERADVLKARSAMLALRALFERYPVPGTEVLTDQLEVLEASAHEITELRLLNELRLGTLDLGDDAEAAERLLGVDGPGIAARLGADDDAPASALRDLTLAEHRRWSELAESPFSGPDHVEAARVLVRTCEGMVASLVQQV
jgi:hypothetical protein